MSNHTGASTEELRDGLVAVALDKVLLLHVGARLHVPLHPLQLAP